VSKNLLARARASFSAGLAIVLPGVISVAVLVWIFSSIANVTDKLLVFLPSHWTHQDQGNGPLYLYWSVAGLVLAVCLIGLIGLLARHYIGKQFIVWVDSALLRVPLLNKIYSATKQVNEALSSGNKTAFRTVVLVEFPRPGSYSIGFITSEQHPEILPNMNEKLIGVFVPTTPNPTGGYLLLLPEDKVTKLEMSVADGLKYVVSLGSILPELTTPLAHAVKNPSTDLHQAGL
jgi:uncharacterized membrane protein